MKYLILLVCLSGCSLPQTAKIDNQLDNITKNAISADNHLIAAKPHANATGQTEIEAAQSNLSAIKDDAKAAKTANKQTSKAIETYQKTLDDPFVKAGLWLRGWYRFIKWTLILGLVLALVSRVGSQFVGGGAGTTLALISTGIFGALSGGISLMQSAFDNWYFRKTKKQKD